MRRRIVVNLLLTGITIVCLVLLIVTNKTPVQHPQERPTILLQEDDPGWDCHTMGNHICE